MPYYHCRKCHHEFEYIQYADEEIKCDWCKANNPNVLEEQTPLEKLCENIPELIERLKQDGSICERENSEPGPTKLCGKGRGRKDIPKG